MSRLGSTPVEVFEVGDHGVFTVKRSDITIGVEGVIADIRREGTRRVLVSGDGHELVTYDVREPRKVYAVMVRKYQPVQTQLEGVL